MALVDGKLVTLCSRGVLAEWSTNEGGVLIDTYEVRQSSLFKVVEAALED
jgi:hypothetical protein